MKSAVVISCFFVGGINFNANADCAEREDCNLEPVDAIPTEYVLVELDAMIDAATIEVDSGFKHPKVDRMDDASEIETLIADTADQF